MQLFDALGPLARGGRLGELTAPVSRIRNDLAAWHIQHLVEARTQIDGKSQRKHALSKVLPNMSQAPLEVRFLFIEPVEDDHLRNAVLGGVFPNRLGADPDAVIGMDDDQREIAHSQGPQALADEIGVTRAIQDIEFLAQPLQVY